MTPTRSNVILDEDLFSILVSLTKKQSWLADKGDEFLSLSKECHNTNQFSLIVDLLDRFTYFDGAGIQAAGKEIVHTIESVWDLSPSNTVITAKNIESQNDSSGAMAYMMQGPFSAGNKDWIKGNFRNNIKDVLNDHNVRNLILIDDFSGSGKSLQKLLTWIENTKPKDSEKNVYACFLCAMYATYDQNYPSILKKLFSVKSIGRGISDHYKEDLGEKVATMVEVEKELVGLPHKYRFGFEKTEALYACQNFNIPNNNFPVFWYKATKAGKKRGTLFPRIERY